MGTEEEENAERNNERYNMSEQTRKQTHPTHKGQNGGTQDQIN